MTRPRHLVGMCSLLPPRLAYVTAGTVAGLWSSYPPGFPYRQPSATQPLFGLSLFTLSFCMRLFCHLVPQRGRSPYNFVHPNFHPTNKVDVT